VVPAGVVTEIGPVENPAGTIAPIVVLFVTTKEAVVPLKETADAFVKFTPVILTVVPKAEFVGVKLAMLAGK
jgi:hypothetical protein